MIKHPIFVRCSTLTRDPQLLYILIKLSKGERFIYKDLIFDAGDNESITVMREKQVGTIVIVGRECADIVSDIERVIGTVEVPDMVVRAVTDCMVHGYVADCVRHGRIPKSRARELYNYISVGQILKVFSPSDIEHDNGRIVDISGIDFNKLDISQLTLASEPQPQRLVPPNRMDSLWRTKCGNNTK